MQFKVRWAASSANVGWIMDVLKDDTMFCFCEMMTEGGILRIS